ncbi:HNH endonuclease [Acetobacter pasteurianus]|uniref:HNH endonuclease n=1 Tax=Acetobacter pasteurianus TaxID=438 RepID=UPI001363CD83|nr:HNH endonuclease [Acetobacter pasteurianus]QHM90231.1 HNH endonuclease [Acetobacter pasteurianus]
MAKRKTDQPLLPLILSVKAANWRMNDQDQDHADREFQKIREKALQRDGYRCRFCNFFSRKFQEVHHKDDDHHNNTLDNLVTACFMCHSVQHIGLSGHMKESVLIWLPEISQAALNHLIRSCIVARFTCTETPLSPPGTPPNRKIAPYADGGEILSAAESVMAALQDRSAEAAKLIGTSDPKELGSILQDIAIQRPDIYETRGEILNGIRLMNLGKKMSNDKDVLVEHVRAWIDPKTNGPYSSGLKADSWSEIMRDVLGIS